MKIFDQKKWQARVESWKNWHPIFAWFPIRLRDGDVVWLQTVERRITDGHVKSDPDGLLRTFEYRRPGGA